MMVKKSLYFTQDEILDAIEGMHVTEGWDADVTWGNGSFWKNRAVIPRLKFDIEPLAEIVKAACSTSIPVPPQSLASIMFDPPFLTYVRAGREHKNGQVAMTSRFGGYWTYDELRSHYVGTLESAHMALKRKGILVVKCQDIIHNHRMHCTHAMVISEAERIGFRLRDLFILAAKHRMPSPQKGTQKHARIFHSYFLVLEKVSK